MSLRRFLLLRGCARPGLAGLVLLDRDRRPGRARSRRRFARLAGRRAAGAGAAHVRSSCRRAGHAARAAGAHRRSGQSLRPDIVFIAGDFISERRCRPISYSFAEAVAPLAGLRSRLGTVAVLGNHDHWRDADGSARGAAAIGMPPCSTMTRQRSGPLAIGGLDDAFTHHQDLGAMLDALRALPGARIILSHSPDPFPVLPARHRLHAGRPHPLRPDQAAADRRALDHVGLWRPLRLRPDPRERPHPDRHAGLGTSFVPLRLGAVPDMWLIRLGPERR